MSNQAIEALGFRIDGLRALIARRESQQGLAASEGVYKDTSKHIEAAQKELRDLAADFVRLKIDCGAWQPLELIERMGLQRFAIPPAVVAEPVVKTVTVDETRDKLADLLRDHSGNFIPRSKLQELIT